MDLELISFKLCPFVQRAVITLARKGLPYRLRYVDLAAPPDWFIALSPHKKVPLLVVDGGPVIFESSVIAEFIDEIGEPRLHPADPVTRAQNRSWIEFGADALMDTRDMTTAPDEAEFKAIVSRHNARLAEIEVALGDGPYFNGAEFSLVDAAWAPLFFRLRLLGELTPVFHADALPKLAAWSALLLAQPEVAQSVVPDFPALFRALIARRKGWLAGRLPDPGEPDGASASRY